MANRRLIERYVLRTIFPYVIASLILLTAILFAQQTGRYFELVFHGIVPSSLVYGLALALLPLHGLTVILDSYARLGIKDITVPFAPEQGRQAHRPCS